MTLTENEHDNSLSIIEGNENTKEKEYKNSEKNEKLTRSQNDSIELNEKIIAQEKLVQEEHEEENKTQFKTGLSKEVSKEKLEKILEKSPCEIRSYLLHPANNIKPIIDSQTLKHEIIYLVRMFAIAIAPTVSKDSDDINDVKRMILASNLFGSQFLLLVRTCPVHVLPSLLNEIGLLCIMNSIVDALSLVPRKKRRFFLRFCKKLYKTGVKCNLHEDLLRNIDDVCRNAVTRAESILLSNKTEENLTKNKKTKRKGKFNFRDTSITPNEHELLYEDAPELRKNIIQGTFESTDDYLETHFCLMREDFVWPIRKAVREYRLNHKKAGQSVFGNVTFYHGINLTREMTLTNKMHYIITFDNSKEKNWNRTEKFKTGTMLCMSVDDFKTIHFGVVILLEDEDLPLEKAAIYFEGEKKHYKSFSAIVKNKSNFLIFESPAFYEPYFRVLKVYKSLQPETFPFEEHIVNVKREIGPPDYLKEDTRYCLAVDENLSSDETYNFPVMDFKEWPSSSDLGLDISQLKALQHALSSSLALIQGPPGTGKTYVGLKIIQTLLNNKSTWEKDDQKPILIVCYTNHALDQFLEGVLEFNQNIVRIGSQSVSEKLREFNLKYLYEEYTKNIPCPETDELKVELDHNQLLLTKQATHIFHENMLDLPEPDNVLLESLKDCSEKFEAKSSLCAWLGLTFDKSVTYPDLIKFLDISKNINKPIEYNVLDPNDGIEVCKLKEVESYFKYSKKFMKTQHYKDLKGKATRNAKTAEKELIKTDIMSEEEVKNVNDLWGLDSKDRWRLYRRWTRLFSQAIEETIAVLEMNIKIKTPYLAHDTDETILAILKEADVIGMTTTVAARKYPLLRKIGCKIVLVEEAAEVFESHIIASLNPKIRHLILIGDHQQLRPLPAAPEISKRYKLDVSLFERLVKNKLPHVTLEQQHRMRPEISSLARNRFYPSLRDHPSVCMYLPVRGMGSNVYYLNHSSPESLAPSERPTYKNDFEAEFIVHLFRYLLQQGYTGDQICILTMYSGQMTAIEQLLASSSIFSESRVTTVDNFQGEESDIILLSLVRSNSRNSIGFLSECNRITVALTRAKLGLYVVGNFDHLAERCKHWKRIVKELNAKQYLGNELPVACQIHPNNIRYIKEGKDFEKFAPNGLCPKVCAQILPCGHKCDKMCHIGNHVCNKSNKGLRVRLRCGHEAIPPCDQNFENYVCRESSTWMFQNCGHTITVECHMKIQGINCLRCTPYLT